MYLLEDLQNGHIFMVVRLWQKIWKNYYGKKFDWLHRNYKIDYTIMIVQILHNTNEIF